MLYVQLFLMSGEDFRRIKTAKHVLNADRYCEVYHTRQTSPFTHVNTISPLRNATVAVKVSKSQHRIGGKCGATTAAYSEGTVCELAGTLNWPLTSSTAKVKNEESYTLHRPTQKKNGQTFNLQVTT